MKPYVYVTTSKSAAVEREAPEGARVAVHYPELGRSVEITTDANGRYTVLELPAPGHGGESVEITRGDLRTLDREAFIDGYVTAALWADCLPPDSNPDAETGGRENLEIRPEARDKLAADCLTFIDGNRADLIEYCERIRVVVDAPEAYAGHDFWLTRRSHGAGYWGRGLGELGERLSEAAHAYGEPMYPFDAEDGTADV